MGSRKMNRRSYFDNQDDMDDETYEWLYRDYVESEKVHLGKLSGKRRWRGDDFAPRRAPRRAKKDWRRNH